MYYKAQTVFEPNDLMHYGVKGMKWGTRRGSGNLYTRGVNALANKLGTGSMVGRAVNQYAGHRYAAEQHNLRIKNDYGHAKAAYRDAKRSGNASKIASTKAAYKTAKKARVKNLAGRAAATSLGYSKAHQGRYYMNRAKGNSRSDAALKTWGNKAVKSIASTLVPGAGVAKNLYDARRSNSADYVRSEKFRKKKW